VSTVEVGFFIFGYDAKGCGEESSKVFSDFEVLVVEE